MLLSNAGDYGTTESGDRFLDVDLTDRAVWQFKQWKAGNGVLEKSEVEIDLSKANGKKLSIVELEVCVGGVDKKILAIATEPYA